MHAFASKASWRTLAKSQTLFAVYPRLSILVLNLIISFLWLKFSFSILDKHKTPHFTLGFSLNEILQSGLLLLILFILPITAAIVFLITIFRKTPYLWVSTAGLYVSPVFRSTKFITWNSIEKFNSTSMTISFIEMCSLIFYFKDNSHQRNILFKLLLLSPGDFSIPVSHLTLSRYEISQICEQGMRANLNEKYVRDLQIRFQNRRDPQIVLTWQIIAIITLVLNYLLFSL